MIGRCGKLRSSTLRWGVLGAAAAALLGYGLITAADHDEAPLIQGDQAADIADLYAFRSPQDPNAIVLVLTLSDFLPPGEIKLGKSNFDPRVLYQFKIDRDGDAVEDLVIQAFVTGSRGHQLMHFRGPAEPSVTGTRSKLIGPETARVRVSTGAEPIVATRKGMKVFAGVRDDPFFFDAGQFGAILAGEATSFNDPGTDSFQDLNVYAIVVELPIERLGDLSTMSVWGTTSRRH